MSNIIKAYFDSNNRAWVAPVWRQDYGMILQFPELELPPAYEVHFSNTPGNEGEASVQIGDENGVTIPSSKLVTGSYCYAWIFLHTGTDDGETEYMVTIPVIAKPTVTEEEPTPAEESAISQAIAALNAAVEECEAAVTHYPTIIDGVWYVYDAENDVYVSTGVTAVGQDGRDGNGIASAVLNADYTLTLTFTDGNSYTTPSIRGAQGPQGEEGPEGQPGQTGATGVGIQSIYKTGTSGNVDTYTILYTNGNTDTFEVTNGAVSSVAGKTGAVTLDGDDVAYDPTGTYQAGTVGKAVSDVNGALTQCVKVENVYAVNRYNPDIPIEVGYIDPSTGNPAGTSSSTNRRTDFLSLDGNDTGYLSFSCQTSFGNVSFRYALYKADKTYVSGALLSNSDVTVLGNRYYYSVAVTNDVKYIRFSCTSTYMSALLSARFQIAYGNAYVTYNSYADDFQTINPNLSYNAIRSVAISEPPKKINGTSINNNSKIVVENNSIKNDKIIYFYGKFSAFGSLSIGHGDGSGGYYVIIDDTNITLATNGSLGTSFAHGLTLTDYIMVIIDITTLGAFSVTLSTKGGVYTKTFTSGWNGSKGDIFVKNVDCVFTEYDFDFVSNAYQKRIWVFGDSYLGTTADKRWPYWMHTWGYDCSLLNGFAGATATDAFTDLQTALKHGKPKYLVWCIGMNNPDSGEVNATWKSVVESIIDLCEKYDITLILSTTPDVTATPNSNDYKNAYVVSSGYRYIDFAGAVSGITGWLDTDNTHPNEIGARLLCAEALADVPELMQK